MLRLEDASRQNTLHGFTTQSIRWTLSKTQLNFSHPRAYVHPRSALAEDREEVPVGSHLGKSLRQPSGILEIRTRPSLHTAGWCGGWGRASRGLAVGAGLQQQLPHSVEEAKGRATRGDRRLLGDVAKGRGGVAAPRQRCAASLGHGLLRALAQPEDLELVPEPGPLLVLRAVPQQLADEAAGAAFAQGGRAAAGGERAGGGPGLLALRGAAGKAPARCAHQGRMHHLRQQRRMPPHAQVGAARDRPEDPLQQLRPQGAAQLVVLQRRGRRPSLHCVVYQHRVQGFLSECIAVVHVEQPAVDRDHEVLVVPVTEANGKGEHRGESRCEGQAHESFREVFAAVVLPQEVEEGCPICGGARGCGVEARAHAAERAGSLHSLQHCCLWTCHRDDIGHPNVLQAEALVSQEPA
mmetsp:Transcript_114601/g.335125  ORF Transcript_114601/g.335125 Transcript_114601/m.335125 type:complete len:409 (+) Transcript_114601:213-1439(+)